MSGEFFRHTRNPLSWESTSEQAHDRLIETLLPRCRGLFEKTFFASSPKLPMVSKFSSIIIENGEERGGLSILQPDNFNRSLQNLYGSVPAVKDPFPKVTPIVQTNFSLN